MAVKVKATPDPAEKRAILSSGFQNMSKAITILKGTNLLSENDMAGINKFNGSLQEKRDELNGVSGFARVQDNDLNAFADYSMQDLEQADGTITISLVALLLIIIIVILLV